MYIKSQRIFVLFYPYFVYLSCPHSFCLPLSSRNVRDIVISLSSYFRRSQVTFSRCHVLTCDVGGPFDRKRIDVLWSADLWSAAPEADMIDSIVDRLYRPIRISNRMRLAKLLAACYCCCCCCCCSKEAVMIPASISHRLRRHHRRATSQATHTLRRQPYSVRVGKLRVYSPTAFLYLNKFTVFVSGFCCDFFYRRFKNKSLELRISTVNYSIKH